MTRARFETIALLVVAVSLRAMLPAAGFFGPDQIGILLQGRGVLRGELFPGGPGIGWTPYCLGPLFEWVAALGLFVRDDFSDVTVLVAIVHGFAVLGWRRLFEVVLGPSAVGEARLAGWALALHPLSISSGSSSVSTSIVLPTTLVFVWGMVQWIGERRPAGFALACIGGALMTQAHITTLFLTPLALIGFWRRCPIGRVGLAGMAAGAVILAPMAIYNLSVAAPETLRHAGTSGAPFWIALARALTVEARVFELAETIPAGWRSAATFLAHLWAPFVLFGAIGRLRAQPGGMPRLLAIFGFVIPTVCVVVMPRGALFLYLDSTAPFRAWLFASGLHALLAAGNGGRGRAVLGRAVRPLATVMMIGSALLVAEGRRRTGELGFAPVYMSRIDLREPSGPPRAPIGILTFESTRRLGETLDELGANPDSLVRDWHGPWSWAASYTVGHWIADARRGRGERDETGERPDADTSSFLVLHERDGVATPPSTPIRAGRFRVYRFENRVVDVVAEGERIAGHIRSDRRVPVGVNLVTDAATRAARLTVGPSVYSMTPALSDSGFVVWSVRDSVEVSEAVSIQLERDDLDILQVRTEPGLYGFDRSPP